MNNKLFRLAGLALIVLGMAGLLTNAHAAAITSLSGGTVLSIPAVDKTGADGQQDVAPGITWNSDDAGSVFGYTGGYGFAENGAWDGLSMAGANSETATMTFAFATPVQGVGAFLNWSPDYSNPTIAVYDVNHSLLGSSLLDFMTVNDINQGEFHGFLVSAPLISYFTLTGGYIGATDLTVVNSVVNGQVPEPAVLALLGLGLFGIGMTRKHKL